VAHVNVTAACALEFADADRLFEGDSVEFYYRKQGAGEDMLQVVISPGVSLGSSEVRMHFFDYRLRPIRDKVAPSAFVARTKTTDGYTMTLALPWAAIGVSPHLGEAVGARLIINHHPSGHVRSRLIWTGNTDKDDFWQPPLVRLDHSAGILNPLIAWVEWDGNLLGGKAYVMAAPELAGQTIDLKYGDQLAKEVSLRKDGDRAIAQVSILEPKPGQHPTHIEICVGHKNFQFAAPDLRALRVARFLAGGRSGEYGRSDSRLTPVAQPAVFSSPSFPEIRIPDRHYAEQIVGPILVVTNYYDKLGDRVSQAELPGRYVARTDVSSAVGAYTVYRTLFRKPEGWKGDDTDPIIASADFEGKLLPNCRPDAARKADQDVIHAVRRRLGTQVKYEYELRAPRNYKSKPEHAWPLIVFLHGSGGGDDRSWPNTKWNDGPMPLARRDPHFPFIVVILRSPGGWFPPAVEDVVDEIESKYSIDKSRVYLTGFSMGGFGTWRTAYDQPERFAALVPVSAGAGERDLMPLIKEIPTWVFNGGDDGTTPPSQSRKAVEALKKVGGNVRYTEYAGQGHVDALHLAYSEKDLYSWLLQQHKQ
jgi:predicted esterase